MRSLNMLKPIKYFTFTTYTVLAVGVAFYAITYLQQPFDPNNPFQSKFALAGWVPPMHFYGAGLALLLTPFQLSNLLRQRSVKLHRLLGLTYVCSVLVGGISGLIMAYHATGGWVAKAGFASLAILWLATTGLAFYHALKRQIQLHRIWVYRSVALTAAGITLRLMLGIGLGYFQLPFLTVYVPVAWLCWVPNLVLCEYLIHRRQWRLQPVV